MITGRRVQVNGNLCLDDQRVLAAGEVIHLFAEALPKPIDADQIQLAYLDEHLVVVEKPAGITTMRHFEERKLSAHRRELQPTLDELLPDAIARVEGGATRRRGQGAKGRPGQQGGKSIRAVHRLDRDTSGLMVFARTVPAEIELVKRFRKHDIRRAYIAVALGKVEAQTVEQWLVRDRGDGRRGTSPLGKEAEGAQRAITHFRSLEHLNGFTILQCRLETGRTHQIRIALSEIGHMLCGERVYHVRPDGSVTADPSGAPRQALHAAELGFLHPITGEKLLFRMPLPNDLAKWITALREKFGGSETNEK